MQAIINISASDILNLQATPKQLVAAPGAGYFLLPTRIIFSFEEGTTPYSIAYGGGLEILHGVNYPWDGQAPLLGSGILEGANKIALFEISLQESGPANPSDVEDQPLMLHNGGSGEYADGDGEATVIIDYDAIEIP